MASIPATVAAPQGNPVTHGDEEQGKTLSLRRMLRESIEESGWKFDAVAAAMSAASGREITGPYLSRMLNGEKSINALHLLSLPDDVEAIFARKYAESFGQIVVTPAATHEAAVRSFVSGLFGMLGAPQVLPVKAGAPLKAKLRK